MDQATHDIRLRTLLRFIRAVAVILAASAAFISAVVLWPFYLAVCALFPGFALRVLSIRIW